MFTRFFNSTRIILIAILMLAAILRFWNLGTVPPSASMDEASIGYNAYSILKTGKDEYGEIPILSHRAYDDYRRATYLYLVTPFIHLFGLNVVAVRLPAVILSILTVLATYFLVKELFTTLNKQKMENIALVAAGLLAISPWHIYISRLGHESNACLAFLVFGVLFFLQGIRKYHWVLILLSMIFFTLSMISYYSGQAFIPLFVVGLFLIFRWSLLSIISSDKKILATFFILLILLVPILLEIFSADALIRFQSTSTFKPEAHSELYRHRVEFWNRAVEENDIVGTILYNRHLFPLQVFIQGYISHFNPEWLFANFSAQPHKVPNMGLLYLWELPFILIGIIGIIFNRVLDLKIKLFIFLWFFLAPLPAALATQTPHAMRSYSFLPTWQIFAAFGLAYALYKLKKFRILVFFAFVLFILVSLATFYKNYFIVFPREQSSSFQYTLSRAIPYVLENEKKYDKVVFSNKDNLYQSYMFFLFYSRYDPRPYQEEGGTKSGGFAEEHRFSRYEFRPIAWNQERQRGKILYIGNRGEIPMGVETIAVFKNLDEREAIIVATR